MSATTADAPRAPASPHYHWAAPGDLNAFFGLMIDNIGVMILMASLLVGVFGMPAGFVLTKMIPGTAVGVLVGDLIYTVMAFGVLQGLWLFKHTEAVETPESGGP